MPEGDSLHRAARQLQVLVGERVEVETPHPRAAVKGLAERLDGRRLEGVEAVGLWRERRWAEYLTAVATAGFLPFEVHELIKRITVLRVGALVVNVAILAWLVWRKRLFGVRGGPKDEERPDPAELFAAPKATTARTGRN